MELRGTPYYSIRSGARPGGGRITLSDLRRAFVSVYNRFVIEHYFQQAFGHVCVDSGFVPGIAGSDVAGYVFTHIWADGLWPIAECSDQYSENDVFDMIEFLYDHVSKGAEGIYHGYNECGWHYREFDQAAGREYWRREINRILPRYGYELSEAGEILHLAPQGFDKLVELREESIDAVQIGARLDTAVRKFRRFRASSDDRRDAVRDLADVLEFLRPRVKGLINSKDERDLFQIINGFSIRHHRQSQHSDYDHDVWHEWMFYTFLATAHAWQRLLLRESEGSSTS